MDLRPTGYPLRGVLTRMGDLSLRVLSLRQLAPGEAGFARLSLLEGELANPACKRKICPQNGLQLWSERASHSRLTGPREREWSERATIMPETVAYSRRR